MGWVNEARKELAAGRQVQVRPFGGSMRGRIESGQFVTLAPISPSDVIVDDVVLVKWRGSYLLHLVKEVQGDQLLIGNNLGKVNGWVPASAVVGKVIAVGALAENELPKWTQRARRYWLPVFVVAVINFTVYAFVAHRSVETR